MGHLMVLTTLLFFIFSATFPVLFAEGHTKERRKVSPLIKECVLTAEAIPTLKLLAEAHIATIERHEGHVFSGDTRARLVEIVIRTYVPVIEKRYLLIDQKEQCPRGMKMHYLD